MKNITQILFLIIFTLNVSAQCDEYIVKGSQVFHANHIRTVINTGGDMFWDLEQARFQVPYNGLQTPSATFASAVWIGGFDDVGNLKLAAQTYRGYDRATQEYSPGPLTQIGIPFDPNCTHWDTIWSVTRYEILLHIHDYLDDGVIDNPQRSIFGWPGAQNPYFSEINGFSLPDYPQQYAPFKDMDHDRVYEPQDGEYPELGPNPGKIPDLMSWHVFNDVREHMNSHGDPLRVEIQQTTYAFACSDNSLLNSTLFIDFKIINRSTSILDSLFFGLWMDPDLGCHSDDFIGSVPDKSAFIVYNQDSIDGNEFGYCEAGVQSYDVGPPVLSGTFLFPEMASFMYLVDIDQLPAMSSPLTPVEHYRVLTGSWRNGAPLCEGGNGYNIGPGCARTTYAFPGDPTDTSSWAMSNVMLPEADVRLLAATDISLMGPGQIKYINLAFTLHLDSTLNHQQNIAKVYDDLPYIREQFYNGYLDCLKPFQPCTRNCVWPGDVNNNGIVDNSDILDLALANGFQGPPRMSPLSWAPHPAVAWIPNLPNGVNMKHADVDGSGVVDFKRDMNILVPYYGYTHDDYQKQYSFIDGVEIIVSGGFERVFPSNFHTATAIFINHEIIDSLYGLAFTILYDTIFFNHPVLNSPQPLFGNDVSAVRMFHKSGVVEFAITRFDGQNGVIPEDALLTSFILPIKIYDLIPQQHDTAELYVANIRAILKDGTEIPMGSNVVRYIFLDDEVSAVSDRRAPMIQAYPNPSRGNMTVAISDINGLAEYEVRSISGVLMDRRRFQDDVVELDLPYGIYVLTVVSGGYRHIEKLVFLE